MRFLTLLLLALPLVLPAQTPEPSLRTTTSEVLLDFVVRDKSARMVRDLRPEEIQVFEDGVPQRVRHFEFVHEDSSTGRVPQKTPAHRGSPSQPLSSATASTVNELRDISVVSLVIANLDPRGRHLALDTMRNFIKDELRPHTYIGVFGLGSGVLRSIQPYTNDAVKISAAMDRVSRAAMLGQLTSNNQLSMPDTDFGSALNGGIGTASDPNGPGGPSGPATFDAGGLAYRVIEPFRSIEIRYEGELFLVEDPEALRDPQTLFARGADATSRSPPMARASSRAIGNPRPVPLIRSWLAIR